jgi:hypothetical protein
MNTYGKCDMQKECDDLTRSIDKSNEAIAGIAKIRRKIAFHNDILTVCQAAMKSGNVDSDVKDSIRSVLFNITEQLKTYEKELS